MKSVCRPGGGHVKLTPELIYEATLDDQLFAELPTIIATTMGARSCVLHWRDEAGGAEVSAHSGYFSDAQMALYATSFSDHDLWTQAGMKQSAINRAWRTSDLVSTNDYAASIFYNEWIRGMGDDTYYCVGSVMQTIHGTGCIGLHRGKTQLDFSNAGLRLLDQKVGHLRRMFAIRARTANLVGRNQLLNAIMSSGRHASFIVSADGRVITANPAGDDLLRTGRFLRARGGLLRCAMVSSQNDFEGALAAGFAVPERQATTSLLRSGDGAIVVASIMPLTVALARPAVLLTIERPRPASDARLLPVNLQRAFALSPSEADIAIRLADGATLREISDQRRTALGTVRTQVKNILLKMDARRQADVIRKVGDLSSGEPDCVG